MLVSVICNFRPWSAASKLTLLTFALQYIAQNSNFGETGPYRMEKMTSGFPSADLQLLCFNSVIHELPESNIGSLVHTIAKSKYKAADSHWTLDIEEAAC